MKKARNLQGTALAASAGRLRGYVALGVAGAVSLLVLSGGCASGPKVGSRAPEFAALDGTGSDVSLADYDGKVVVLYFWATWCAPCAVSGPAIQDLHVRYSRNGDAAVVGVHYDDRGDAVAYQKKQGYTFDVIPDGRDVVSRFGIKKIPSFVIVGGDGTVLLSQIGFAVGDEVEFEGVIDAHIEASSGLPMGDS